MDTDGGANAWLTEQDMTGPDQGFILFLGCSKTVVGIMLKNTPETFRCGTKKFRILGSVSEDGPWQELLEGSLKENREQPSPVQQFMFAKPSVASFIKFELLEYWGTCGGLQYFAVNSSTGQF